MAFPTVTGVDERALVASASKQHARAGVGMDDVSDGDRRLMSAFSICHDGRYYRYNGYRYDRLADAVAYAELMQVRQSMEIGPHPFSPEVAFPPPSSTDRETMAAWRISFKAGTYTYREFRYDRLVDAVNYARVHGADRR